ncbi:hypothetical protein [Methanosarcina sp.]|uniref:DUF7344 domain-containing protein n=1 Tax=Methanosarcina sp. TaxID=2213 RepID=UPI0029896FE5|nr:hypothetical protein [Methanosarcina sp.]MDW5550092.1 hypothetical protein [Methanosarcina sp.]MDW5554046.1 hypothetical protein [Methanosarcina sp.]MDW5558449.1 hypothetical protein [Methanosarcina sp.]
MTESVNYTGNSQRSMQMQPQLSKSDIFGVLQNDRRRYVLEFLRTQGSQSIRSLSEEIARVESQTEEPKSNVRKSVYISLLQTHIPKMESLGIIAYNREQDTVELLPASRDFDVYMETVKKGDIPWSQFYLGLSALAIVGSVTIFTGLIQWISSFQWMLFTSITFFVSSAAHLRHVRKLEE